MAEFQTCTPSQMSEAEFVQTFGSIYEHSPWIAKAAFDEGLTQEDNQILHLQARLARIFVHADDKAKLQVILAHPDLAGKAAVAGELTAESSAEQQGAGIHLCSAQEFEKFQRFNQAYKDKFNFPFIMAVRGADRYKILAAFETRLENSPEQEFERAIDEINKIAAFRLADL